MILDGDRNLGTASTIGTYATAITMTGGQIWPGTFGQVMGLDRKRFAPEGWQRRHG